MSYPINYPTPQNANVQIFNAGDASNKGILGWTKPQGASFVWFTLIGGGASGDGAAGGGSGAVTNFMCPAFLIPDFLEIVVGGGGEYPNNGTNSRVYYVNQGGATYYSELLSAQGGTAGGNGGTAMTANFFTAMGFFQSIAGQVGSTGTVTASNTTFLSGGGQTGNQTSNYGYTTGSTGNRNGFFQMQPIIVGAGGMGIANGGMGCGGGTNGDGGNGLVVIITW